MTDLKKHLGGPKHVKLHVVCPWCYGTARQLRVWDLKRHVDHIHKGLDLLLPGDLFIESTMFYFSLHPDVYSRVVRPTPTEHANAIVAMDAIRALVRSYPTGLSRDMDEWEQGWLLAIATPLSDERQPPRVQPSVYTSFAMRVAEVPEAYSPSHPAIHPHVVILSASADGSHVDVVKDGQEGYRVSLSPDTIRNEDTVRKIHNSLSNPSNQLVGGTTTPAPAKVLQEMSEIVADMLDLSESCIDSVDSYVDPPIRRPVIHPVVDAAAIVMPRRAPRTQCHRVAVPQ